ncbi:hypothetical protein [Clostridium estertheticum]|uniref:hypothetical protein n=1 Tax=Clostridium estertheticum TaxID=238834 RepID=UPI001CF3D8F1|nr:hypothetical protein [Clostridium estertheticum]MCB2356693.1 hypothetical protein [Clostridium estertheticum]WAG42779.1 hypothetical protein LL065_08950 [Clostridium estertheticum]
MLDIMEVKLLQMREITDHVKQGNLRSEEIVALNARINNLASQVNAIDSESKITEDKKIIE